MKVLVLGSDGFVGSNLLEDLGSNFCCAGTTRKMEVASSTGKLLFDLEDRNTWTSLVDWQPDVVVNCIVSEVIRQKEEARRTIDFNYLITTRFYDFLFQNLRGTYLIHLGSAFEYDLSAIALTEETRCKPETFYGIAKLLASYHLINNFSPESFTILRPFNMFGPYDEEQKIIPHLIAAQRDNLPIDLSNGIQKRDYFFVKDLSAVLKLLINFPDKRESILNVGSGRSYSVRDVAAIISENLSEFDPGLWRWGRIPDRPGESSSFYNASDKLKRKGFCYTEFEKAIKITVSYYINLKKQTPV